MNPILKRVLIVTVKNAVNALLINVPATQFWPAVFSIHNHAGQIQILKLCLSIIGAREIVVWGPVILKWSQTNSDIAN